MRSHLSKNKKNKRITSNRRFNRDRDPRKREKGIGSDVPNQGVSQIASHKIFMKNDRPIQQRYSSKSSNAVINK